MLVDMMSGKPLSSVPFGEQYREYLSRMTPDEVAAIKSRLHEMIEGTEIQTAGWMPGRDWSDTVFEPIYFKAAKRSYEQPAKCFGLMVWEVFMERPERWTSGRFEKDGEAIGSRTYFQVT